MWSNTGKDCFPLSTPIRNIEMESYLSTIFTKADLDLLSKAYNITVKGRQSKKELGVAVSKML